MKKLLALLLALLMLVPLVVSCANNNSDSEGESTTKSTASENGTNETDTGEKVDVPDTKYGKDLTFLCFNDSGEWSVVDIYTEKDSDDVLKSAIFQRNLYLKDTYDVTIKEVQEKDIAHPRFWLAGYSRGAAVANLTAGFIQEMGLAEDADKAVGKYSMGMRQRLGIAQAIMEDPSIIILDEPMNGLDNQGVEEMRNLFLKLKEEGKTFLIVSHNREDIEMLCDHVYMMDHGVLSVQR